MPTLEQSRNMEWVPEQCPFCSVGNSFNSVEHNIIDCNSGVILSSDGF